jgi:hypothetical protein
MKASRVRRSDQGKGALEPDLVIAGCPFWLELQDAGPGAYSPARKLAQAVANVGQVRSPLMPVAICHLRGSRSIEVAIRIQDLWAWRDGAPPIEQEPNFMVTFDYAVFLELLAP